MFSGFSFLTEADTDNQLWIYKFIVFYKEEHGD